MGTKGIIGTMHEALAQISTVSTDLCGGRGRCYTCSMSSKTKIEYVMGELVTEDGKQKYTPKLKLTVKEMYADETPMPVARAVAQNELTPTSGLVIEDGTYKLRYAFDGQQQEHSVRIQGGHMLAG